ncbi:phage BR0599 family protein [Wolbachia endosymbiont (group B) of Agrotis puta]
MLLLHIKISTGDKYSILAGCDKAFLTCKNKFNNTVNFRGEPYIPVV